ncbi:hypothetical protein OPQ81_004357 [Rhizoctonia solani]|nr:hypothetical protein OPQ81_004357 [Rhizoctonia solani]
MYSGGARGLSALILLEELMKRMQPLKKLDSPPYPYQCFDVIAGTGTGAIQACMLGRLRMPVNLAIESYADLAKEVFSEKKRFRSESFKRTKLKGSLRRMILTVTGDPEEPMIDRQQIEGRCKTLVFAMSSHDMRVGIPTVFRSYPVISNEGPRCTIWETLCATMAHPDLFKSFEIGRPPLNQSFVDAGLGCNNPLSHVLAEVKTLYPERYVASVTSIGTGHTCTIQTPNTSLLRHFLPITAIVAMKRIATDTERVAEETARRFNSAKDEWKQLSQVLEYTRAYMKQVDVNQRINEMAQGIHSRKPIVPTVQIDGEIRVGAASASVPPVVRHCPAPTPIFTGCESKLCKIESCITGSIMERKVCVVHGLGGAGKTQMALKVIERTYNQWKEIIYVDASTQESIESALKDFAKSKKVGDTYQDALQWLGLHHERWLVVFDNADDPSLPLCGYIPGGNHGSIIITTRISGMQLFAQGTDSNCSVSCMDPDDALALLLKLAQKQDHELSPGEVISAKALLQDFDHFALAIVHAGTFIGQSPHMTITEYRSLFMREQQRALEAYRKLPAAVKADNYSHTVYTAWLMCYELLHSQAQKLLWLLAFLHHAGITIEIFRRAAANIMSYKPTLPTTSLEDLARQKLRDFLRSFLDVDQCWDTLLFTESLNEIVSRSLLEYDHLNQCYRIHVLVQGWVRMIVPWEVNIAVECARTLLSMSIPTDNSLESVIFRMSIGLHIDKTLLETPDGIGANHALLFSRVYEERGQWKQGMIIPTHYRPWSKLALTYRKLKRINEARDLQVQVLDARKRVLGDDHPVTLSATNNLALIYSELNQINEARDLQVQVLDAWKRVLGDDHPDTLSTMSNLALTYWKLNRLDEARYLQVQVLDARKRVLGDDHPDTLSAMNNLALTYWKLDRFDEARYLQVQVLDARKRVLGDYHPDTLSTMSNLANTYWKLNRLDEARDLQVQMLDARKRVLGDDHPNKLLIMVKLAINCLLLRLQIDVEELQFVQVTEKSIHLLRVDGWRSLGGGPPWIDMILIERCFTCILKEEPFYN